MALLVTCARAESPEPKTVSPVKTVSSVEILPEQPAIPLETRTGQPLDEVKVRNDVKALWRSGRFADVRVEETPADNGLHVVFHVEPKPKQLLRRIDVKPPTPGIDIQLPLNTQIDDYGAQLVATSVQKQLIASGYGSAKVTSKLVPAGGDQVDLKVDIDRGDRVDVGAVTLAGDLGEPGLKPRKALKWTSSKTMIPGIPGIWKGWHIIPGFNDSVAQNDAANLTSFYYSRGYFDADVKPSTTSVAGGKAGLRFDIQAGPRYFIRSINVAGGLGATEVQPSKDGTFPVQQLCNAMLDERRRAERLGVLDFSVRVEARDVPAPETQIGSGTRQWVDLTANVERGPSYKIGRIEFVGSTSFTDRTYRRSMIFDEGDPLDEFLLRKSLARLNNTGLFEPLSQADVVVNTPSGTDRADLTIRLRERKSRHWYFSGPVGPLSLGDSLQFAIGSRLPPWGKRVIDLSTFTLSMNLMFFAKPLGSLIPGFTNTRWLPLMQISRPLLPGQFMLSGFSVSPQLGWQGVLMGYGASQVRNLLGGALDSSRSYTPPLTVSVAHTGPMASTREGAISCEPQKTKLDWVKQITDITTRFAFSFFPF